MARMPSAQWRINSRERAMASSRAAFLAMKAARMLSEIVFSSLMRRFILIIFGLETAEKLIGQCCGLGWQRDDAIGFFEMVKIHAKRLQEKLGVSGRHHNAREHTG